jgi:hypothetical protein
VTTARALRTRADLRGALGLPPPESSATALADHGFVVHGAFAYLPTGRGFDEVAAACRPGGRIDHARAVLPHPGHLDCILVCDDAGGRRGVNMDTGAEVPVP